MRRNHSGPLNSESPTTEPPPLSRAAIDRSIQTANHGREVNSVNRWRRQQCQIESETQRN
jgi:hypothetical protein